MDEIRIILPKQYDLVVGDTFQLFYRGVVDAPNPYVYDIVSVCEVGSNYPRYYEFTPEKEGQHKLEISVFAPGKKLLGRAQSVLNVKKAEKSAKDISVLCMGDSLTAGGVWVEEVRRRINDNGGEPEGLGFGNVNFIGTCKKGKACYEGYGGWKWDNYISKESDNYPSMWVNCNLDKTAKDQHSLWKDENGAIWQIETIDIGRLKFNRFKSHQGARPEGGVLQHYKNAVHTDPIEIKCSYNEEQSPFYDEESGTVSIKKYCEKHSFKEPDIIYVLLGINGLAGNAGPFDEFICDVVSDAKRFVNMARRELKNVRFKILGGILPSLNGGTGANYGSTLPYCDDYGITRYIMDLSEAYRKWAEEDEYKDFVEYINLSGQFDAEYNFPQMQKQVNTRNKTTEIIGTNGVHPTEAGQMQIADAVFRNLVKTVGEINEF